MQTEELGKFGYSLNIVERAIEEKLQELWRHIFLSRSSFWTSHWSYSLELCSYAVDELQVALVIKSEVGSY